MFLGSASSLSASLASQLKKKDYPIRACCALQLVDNWTKCETFGTMIPQFSGGSSLSRTDATHVQAMHGNAFPMVEFSEPPMETPLDLNFSQRGPQNIVRGAQNEGDNGELLKRPEIFVNTQQQEVGIGQGECVAPSSDTGYASGSETPISKTRSSSVDTPSSRTRAATSTASPQISINPWALNELVVLFDAKKAQAEKSESGPRKLRSATPGKWEEIADACKAGGVNRPATQFREKWERLWPAFRTILDWEIKVSERKTSFWTMTEEERVQGGFPNIFDREVYDAMLARFSFVTSLNSASPIFNSLNVDSVAASFNQVGAPADAGQNGVAAVEDGLAIVEHKTPARKRRMVERAGASKQSPSESSKRATILIDPKEENLGSGPLSPVREVANKEPRGSRSKNPLDIVERRLLLEEKKMKLAEQRFSLEEKKLEATIEIGKGLIASMERMTGTISGLGAGPPQQR